MLPSLDDCDDCVPSYAASASSSPLVGSPHLLSLLFFSGTFVGVAFLAIRKFLPLLAGIEGTNGKKSPLLLSSASSPTIDDVGKGSDGPHHLPLYNYDLPPLSEKGSISGHSSSNSNSSNSIGSSRRRSSTRTRTCKPLPYGVCVTRLPPLTFAANLGLSTVLVELLLCEILSALDPAARRLALNITLPALMVLLVIVTPALQLHSILAAMGLKFASTAAGGGRMVGSGSSSSKAAVRVAWVFEAMGLALWLLAFWYVGHGVLGLYLRRNAEQDPSIGFREACLERIGVIGISLMATLAGFAAVSALWHAFGVRHRQVTDAHVSKKESSLDAMNDMLAVKRSRLRAIERKLSEAPSESLSARLIGAIRGGGDSHERTMLQVEISGLETMRISLVDGLYALRARKAAQQRANTLPGRLLNIFSFLFSIYCLYRLCTASFNIAGRVIVPLASSVYNSSLSRAASTSSLSSTRRSDPVTSILSVMTKHWDPELNRKVWTRQISFLLSGSMLLASFNSALQTFLLLSRAFPSLAASAAAFRNASTLALLISQVCATYVISSALLLRSSLPRDVGSAISDAMGAPLELERLDGWFDAWFLGAAGLTALGIWIGARARKAGFGWDDDDLGEGLVGDVEMGKRN